MMKNDYRRSLIMLRTHAQGYSGHIRLERRTLMGTMYAVINAPRDGGTLCASLVRRNADGKYSAVKLGELRRDGRGQATLAYSFDPRNIDGFTLEDYWIIAIVARSAAGSCSVVLSGNVNGSREVDWSDVQAAACAICSENKPPVCNSCLPPVDVPARPGEGPLGPQTPQIPPVDVPARPSEGPLGPQTPQIPPVDVPTRPGEGPLGPQTPSIPAGQPAVPEEGPAELPTPELNPSLQNVPSGETFLPAFDLPADLPLQTEFAPATATAAEVLGLDSSVRWPGVSEQVRMYFTQPPKAMSLRDGYTYVSAPMPAGSGYDHVEVGLKAEDGVPVSVAYALPARYTPEPPPGLEEYTWKGTAGEGWWVIETDNYTGEKII